MGRSVDDNPVGMWDGSGRRGGGRSDIDSDVVVVGMDVVSKVETLQVEGRGTRE